MSENCVNNVTISIFFLPISFVLWMCWRGYLCGRWIFKHSPCLFLAPCHHEKSRTSVTSEVIKKENLMKNEPGWKPRVEVCSAFLFIILASNIKPLIIRKINKEFLKWVHCSVVNEQIHQLMINMTLTGHFIRYYCMTHTQSQHAFPKVLSYFSFLCVAWK